MNTSCCKDRGCHTLFEGKLAEAKVEGCIRIPQDHVVRHNAWNTEDGTDSVSWNGCLIQIGDGDPEHDGKVRGVQVPSS